MAPPNRTGLERILAYLVAATVVLGTYGVWLAKTWYGEPVNVLVVTMALLITLAGARVVFGGKTIGMALESLSELRSLAQQERDQERPDE